MSSPGVQQQQRFDSHACDISSGSTVCLKVNAAEHHLVWEAMGPAVLQKAESLGMETNNLHEGLPQQPSQGYVDAKLYAARMR